MKQSGCSENSFLIAIYSGVGVGSVGSGVGVWSGGATFVLTKYHAAVRKCKGCKGLSFASFE